MSITSIEQKIKVFSESTPNKIAIEFGEKKVSYLQLDEITSKVAKFLMDKYEDVKNVFIMTERGPSQIEALIGVVKSGGIFIPIDPNVPDNRIITMLQEVQSNWIITTSTLVNRLNKIIETIGIKMNVLLMESNDEVDGRVFDNLNVFSMEHINKVEEKCEYYPNKHCYIYFTSGSTGKPKGVLGRHRSLLQFIEWEIKEMGVNSEFRVSQLTSPSFDPFLRDVFVPLCAGGTLCIPDNQEFVLNPIKLIEWIEKNHITLIHTVPSVFKMISNEIGNMNKFSSLKYILLAGEILRGNDVKKFMDMFGSKIQLVNLYGPTETTLAKLFYRINESDSNKAIIPVGKPIDFTDVLILNESLEVCATSIVGEIYIRTPFITSGYCNDKELTKKVFLKNPFTENPKDIIYKTGDLGRMFSDGNVEIVGRADNQVKIRGMRIELGEVENRLLQHSSISETVVIAKEDEDTKYLCAYIISNEKLEVNELRKFLLKNLPEAMVPSHFIQVDKMPLTTSGKIDRKKLLMLQDFIESEIKYVAPKNEIEEKLVEMWANILKRENIGVENNFFELGGHSLKAARFIGEMHKEFNVEISLVEFFESPIIRKIAEYIEKADKNIYVAIEKIEEREYYPVSSAQRRMFIINQLSPESTNYNLPIILKVEGKFNTEQAEKAMYNLILRHESLRTSFHLVEGEIIQKINTESIKGIKYSNSTEENLAEVIKKFIKPFNLKRGQLIRLEIVTLSEGNYILMFDKHHIISDGSSTGIFIKEFLELYQGNELEELRIQYKDYSQWQNSLLKSKVMEEQKEYWINRFKDEIPVLNMPTDSQRPLMQSFEGENISFKLDKELTKNLKRISKETGSTMYMVLLSGINILLSKYSGQEDIVVGSPIAGRPHADLLKIIGMFVSTLAMRNYPDGSKTYEDFLKEVKENALKAYENQNYQFDELVDKLSIPRDISRNPLFDVMFTMQNMDSEEIELKDLVFKGYKQERKIAKFDLTFSASEMVENIILNLQYSTKLYKRETIERMVEHFVNILKAVAIDTKVKLSKIDMLTEQEKHKLLYEFNDTYVDYLRNKTVHELFEEQVEKTPDNVAVVFEDKKLTYRELNEKANKLARTLREKGVKPDSIVGIMVERSAYMIVGIMGVLKAGGAYLPIDPGYPEERIKYMLEDGKVEILLSQSKLKGENVFKGEFLDLEDENYYGGIGENLDIVNSSRDLAYIIYTSGSTGKPKGVMIEHKNVLSLISALFNDIYSNYGLSLNIALVSPYVFDASVKQIFPAILLGHKLFIVSEEARTSGELLVEYYNNNLIDISDGTPVHINMLANARCKENTSLNVKCFIIGGDVFPCETVRKFLKKFAKAKSDIVNIYGPTECCVDSIFYNIDINKIEDLEIVPIGKPMCNELIYILGKNLEVLPVGIVGELYISGEGVGRGYLNRAELTSEKFIKNPFIAGERMYKTGDLARWLPDGNVEFHGRIDHQVKVRGFRIELGEIESQLLNHESVREVVVLGREDENGAKYLCAYLVPEKELTVEELRSYLSRNLPEYMIPSYFVQLDKMPLTSNGKISRKALPEPDGSIVIGTEYEAARNEVEEKLVAIWKDVLASERVGINDNFFELGGHSLKATTLVSKIHKELNVEVPLREIFKFPTIKGISEYIGSTQKSIYSSIGIVEEKEYYEASSAQKRMYMLQQFDLSSTGYNMPGVMLIEGRLEIERLEKSFTELIRRHETLRTSFEAIEEKIVQRVNGSVNFKLDCFEVGCIESTDKAVGNIVKGFVKVFDLNKAPLLRVGLIKLKEDKHILMFDIHHIISDGVSMGILINEFAKIYEGNKLEQLKIQYKDYSQWQNSLLKSDVMQEQKEYWINRFSDEIPVLNMSSDFQRPLIQSFEGESISCKLDKKLTKDLKRISKETGSTMYMVLLSGVNILLSKHSGQKDIIVGSPIAGRPHADLLKVIGIFVNTLAMRNHPDGSKTYEEFLKEVKENALKAYENQDYQFDELVDNLSIPRDISRNPLFDVMFTMQNIDSEEIELKDLIFRGYKQEHKVAKFDLTFSASEMAEDIMLNLQYSTKLYKKETIEKMIEHFVNILKSVAIDTKIKLSEIDMLTEGEKHKLLFEFNDTYADYPRDKTIHELFEEQALKTPGNIAVVFEDKKLTYRELNERANKLARTLREKGVKPDSIVGIMVERSFEMIVGIMGVLKAGGAYLPIDPEYPEVRIRYMIEDSKTNILLTQGKLIGRIQFNGEVIDLEDEEVYSKNGDNLQSINTSVDLAYVIYTSGSTGIPKGVLIEHKGISNLQVFFNTQLSILETDKIIQFASNSFDASAWEIFMALLLGAELHMISKEVINDYTQMSKFLVKNSITVATFPPNYIINLNINEMISLRKLITAGSATSLELISKCKDKVQYMNAYGPTETTICSTIWNYNSQYFEPIITIGRAINNTKVYILDKKSKLQPIGAPGEICISGEGLARGYLNKPELTAEKFIESPFVSGERMYKTGDLARWLPDGNIEFLGRIDHQVKIRGFRIELGEIESQLLNHESVKESIVLDREDENGSKYLCAYLVSQKELTVGELRVHLSKKLPEYMIPSYFVQLDKMPLTPNGKIDRKVLPDLDGSIVTGTEYEAPRNEVEEKLAVIWREMLGVERVGINDNFFELGGHSLKATALVSKIHKELNVEVLLREIFKCPTIKGISEYIERTEKSIYSSIEIVEDKEYYEASSAQKRMYMIQQFDLDSTGYNMPGVMVIEGRLEEQRLEKSFAELIRRHETLRTSFETIEDKIIQRVHESVNFKLNYFEVDCIENQEKTIDNIVKDFVKTFDLNKAPLLRVGLIKLEEEKHILMYDMHHIISDGVSMGILTNEFSKIYEGDKLEQLRIQYKDYSEWQNSLLKSEVMQEQKKYWINRFKDEIPVLNMRADFQRPLMQSFEGETISFKLDRELTKDLKRISNQTGSTMYMVFLSGVNILLSKYSGQEDIIVGSPIAGRPHADLLKIIGIFVNTLAMRNHPEGNKTYEDFLKEVKENALKAYENQDYQFDALVDNLSIPRDISRNPLFDVMVTMQNMDSEEIELKDLVFKGYNQENRIAKFDLTFSASEMVENIILNLQYSTKLYKRETIEIMIEHFVNILKAVAADTKIKLSEIDMLTEREKHKLLYEFNDTYTEYPRDKTINELFEKQVEKTPDSIAIVFEDKKLTYRELNERANRLARNLRGKGVKPDSIVGIMVERSLDMIVGIMSILKAGGAYLPIDSEYPEERIDYMLHHSKTNILLTQSKFIGKLDFSGELINLEDQRLYSNSSGNLESISTSKDLAYVIYTSGSTGKPKGVMIEQKSVVNLCNWCNKKYNIGANKNALQMTNISFDVSVEETIGMILNGGTIYIPHKDIVFDKSKFKNYINENKINLVQFVPATLNELIAENDFMESLSVIICGGDKLDNTLKNKVISRGYNLYNNYGPTEITVDAISTKCSERNVIGKPIDNTQIYILNSAGLLQPIGIAGEIYVSGEGVARGYLNRTELTAEKFIENPFIAAQKMYKTGDLGSWTLDGNIEFLGRIDHQVKIRGFRIELGEIESQLLTNEAIKETIVIDRQDINGNKYLCAYIVSEKELIVGELRKHLSNSLPQYMIPSYFVQLEKMPLTANGKIDRKALPKPDGNIVTGIEYEAPRNEVEEKLASIWKDVLAVERVGINDNFFELGGHSLKATTLVSKIHKELNVEVPLREIFKFPTIKGTSEYIESTEKIIYSSIEIVEEKEYYEASSAQKRMYMLQQFDLKSTGYNMPGVMLVEGRLEVERLEKSFIELIRRHETLRTSFETIEDKIVQRVNESVNFKLDCFKVGFIENTDETIGNIVKDFVKAFDLNKAPLLRLGLIKLGEDKHILMYDMHHIISDGASMGILINEFAKIYEGNKLEQLRIQYKDYSQWQNDLLKSDVMQEQKEYWINKFSDEIPVLNMRTDFQRPLMQSFAGESISLKLDKELTKGLKRISKETGTTMYMVLLSGVNILLSKHSGQEDIIVGSPIAGRPHADLLKIIGIFVNTLAMRNYPEGSKTYEDFLKEVKENALKAYENQDYQFDELVDKLTILRDISRNPLFDVMFTMQNIDSEDIELKDLVFKGYKQEHKVAKFDLTFSASEMVENIILNLQYSTKLYKRETIETMMEHFVNILKAVTADTKIKLSEIDMLTEREKHKLLYEFNDTYADYPRDKTIHELFEEQVEKTPDNIAVVFEDRKLTYRELNEKANKLARTLRKKGVKSDCTVGIMVERSLEMIVGMFGVLKSGGAYLPIDSEYPADRIRNMIEDSNTNILLTQSNLIGLVEFHGEVIDLKDEEVYSQNGDNLEKINTTRDLAYVIYTSGSTGKPKGVMIEHGSIATTLQWRREQYKLNSDDSILQLFSNTFDGFVTSFYTPIISGSQVVILSDSDAKDVFKIRENILLHKITHFISVPSMCLAIIENLTIEDTKNLRIITLAGESLTVKIVEKCKNLKEELEIVNEYGPTENSVVTTIMRDVRKGKQITIGSPKANTRIYIVDKKDALQPIGVSGELCISGEGLARGYLNNPELTAEKFIESPFVSGERMYKTGDLARWLPDGNIDFLGRIDNQVKIRGVRIELGEIESNLLTHKAIMEVVVIDKEDENRSKYLCAYLVSEKELTVGELRAYLSKKLPEYMIPSYFVQLDKMPLTQNGKVNRKELPEPNGRIVTGTEYEAPRNEVEEKLVKIWSEVLGVDKVGINDNFFELGGHSLKATILVGKMYKEFNVEVPLKVIFKIPTIKDISKCILNKDVFTAYKDYSESEAVIKLNDTKTKNIFVFPPILGYGIVYNDFAKHIEHHTLYSFDFIEDKNRIKEYVKQITNIQKEGKYTLMGYSAGGNLAFEVAKELENRGYEVDHIILLDSGVRDKKTKRDSESLKVMKVMVDGVTEYVRINAPFMLEYISENVQRKLEKFALYLNELTNNGNINANIHLILSSSENIDKETLNSKLNRANEWSDLTKKCFKVYQGYGEHGEMINNDNIKLNTQILNEILM